MPDNPSTERIQTVVIGGGQAGLSTGYYLARQESPFVILEAHERIGETWRDRWDSLRLFTPARYDGLAGMPFPADPSAFPTKNEMGDYLESYADRFSLPVRTGARVARVSREDGQFVVETRRARYLAENVVVAMAGYQKPVVPPFAQDLDGSIRQLHSCEYRNPGQLQPGAVLIVGAGNSGSEIARELAPHHPVYMSGRDVGHLPFRVENRRVQRFILPLVLRGVFHRVLTVRTPLGRKVRPAITSRGGPLIRVKPADLAAAGVERVPRTTGAHDGQPELQDGRILPVANVIWCTGFHPGFSWIDLPVHGEREPRHRSGIVPEQPGLYFVGLHFLHALSSAMIHGVSRDARRIAKTIGKRSVLKH